MWESFILAKLQEWQFLAYVLIFVGMVVEGEIVLLAAIFSAHSGFLSIPYVLLASVFGMIVGDIAWYWVGPHIERFFIPKRVVASILPIIDKQLRKRTALTIFVAKFIYFLHRVVLVRARPSGIPFSKFWKPDLTAIIAWVAVSTVLGIVFAASFSLLKQYLRFAEIGLLIVVVLFAIGEHYLGKYYKKKLLADEAENPEKTD